MNKHKSQRGHIKLEGKHKKVGRNGHRINSHWDGNIVEAYKEERDSGKVTGQRRKTYSSKRTVRTKRKK